MAGRTGHHGTNALPRAAMGPNPAVGHVHIRYPQKIVLVV